MSSLVPFPLGLPGKLIRPCAAITFQYHQVLIYFPTLSSTLLFSLVTVVSRKRPWATLAGRHPAEEALNLASTLASTQS